MVGQHEEKTKDKMICAMIVVLKAIMQIIYNIFKIFPARDRVCFFSRQSDTLTKDFDLLQKELKRVSPMTEQKTICHRFRDGRDGVLRFAIDQIRSLYFLATSEVCVLDAYWPAVCMLRHRDGLTVIQIWHSVGKIKRSGYQTLGTKSGRNALLAKALCMHKNYTYIISGGSAWESGYCEAFNVTPNRLKPFGLPRLDWIIGQPEIRPELEQKYPEIKNKTVVLYAPTYRKYPISAHLELSSLFAGEKYAFICRLHPNQVFDEELPDEFRKYDKEGIFSLIQACDYLITDYSSLALEASALGKRTIYYLFDHDRYIRENGLNIDPAEEMPGCSFERGEDVFEAVESEKYDEKELRMYQERFLPDDLGHSTERIISLIVSAL